MKLYWSQAVPPDAELLEQLSAERRDRVLRCHDPETASAIAAAGLLLAEYVPGSAAVVRTPAGKPCLPCGPEFSLSHGGALAALLVADVPCGVDVERVERAASERVRARVLRPEEAASGRTFAWLWTRKEAVMKLDGRGLGLDPQRFSVLGARMRLDGREIALATQIVHGYFISIAYEIR